MVLKLLNIMWTQILLQTLITKRGILYTLPSDFNNHYYIIQIAVNMLKVFFYWKTSLNWTIQQWK